jgi:hypothetical protein
MITLKSKSRLFASAAVTAGIVALTLGSAIPAQATTAPISGQVPGPGYVVQYNTARVNSYPRNVVSFTPTSVGNAGGALTIALRNSSNRTFARATSARSAVTVKADNGNIWVAGGSFYINAEISGGCGAPCGASTWSANLSYSIKYTG